MAAEEDKQKSIPVLPWMRSPIDVSSFDECPLTLLPCLDPRLKVALENMEISSLFPVQLAVWQETIGPGSFERDLCINSPTGSGKTLAYALPIVQMLSTRSVKCLRALVVLPTRDLALQVKEVFSAIAPAVGLSVGLAVGQSSIADEISELINRPKLQLGVSFDPEDFLPELQSSVDILVATPGRLMDHINNTKGFTLEHLCYLVVDETDRLLREAYQSWLPTVLQITRAKDEKLHLCLVACDKHGFILTFCESKYKPLYLVALLQSLGEEKCIVFTSSVESTHRLCTLLNSFDNLPFKIKEYSGLQRQSVRSKTLKAFRRGDIQVLVSSDAMTRGMDVEGVRNVINYDMPAYIKTYIHRAGRTARAGQTGCCFTLLREDEVKRFNKLLRKAENNSCSKYSVPSSYIEPLHSVYESALEKLKETVEMETSRKRKTGFKSSFSGERK
ncbi:DEAD-box ATP-dependent RNA helicase 1 isoform X2 [Prunus yedoensis var. nudiflora]|uniref:ATP-dependent RNA helicase n=1 Tax=Prunus yedoensis var. nudiflora TaxID=2094558 RepID=A0A314XHX2_PRUYE|nr:DEAD-box ATP-dependent RNA helicase 1 isoform X2 [Prunus yedoensis var. nudiflora]